MKLSQNSEDFTNHLTSHAHSGFGFDDQVDKEVYDSRTIMLFGQVNMNVAQAISSRLWALSEKSKDPIKFVVNSPGGHVESGYTIFDMIRFLPCPVKMIGTGWVGSIAAFLYLAVDKKDRFSLPNTRYLLHQPSLGGVMRGQATDLDIQAREMLKTREIINKIIADSTGQDLKKVGHDTERDFWMSAEEAKAYGMVGKIINKVSELG